MNLITANVLRHLAWQVAAAALTAAVAAIAKVDYSSLGFYAPLAQSAAALLGSMVNEALARPREGVSATVSATRASPRNGAGGRCDAVARAAFGPSQSRRGVPMLSHAELAEIAGRCYRRPWSGKRRSTANTICCRAATRKSSSSCPAPIRPIRSIGSAISTRDRAVPEIGVCHSGFGAGATTIAGERPRRRWGERG